MSVSISKADGVTMLTMTSDPDSACPPLCQILKGLCYSPVCCSVSRHMRRIQTGSLSVLGTLHIMSGVFSVALGAMLAGPGSYYVMDESGFPFWTGALFVLLGVVSVLTEKFPSPCLVLLHLALHLAGVGLAVAAAVVYSMNTADIGLWFICEEERYRYHSWTPQPQAEGTELLKEKCLQARDLSLALLRSISSALIVLSLLELCVVVSGFVLGVKLMRSREEKAKQSPAEAELSSPLLQDGAS